MSPCITSLIFVPSYTGVTITWGTHSYVCPVALLRYFEIHGYASPSTSLAGLESLRDTLQTRLNHSQGQERSTQVQVSTFTPDTLSLGRAWSKTDPQRFTACEYVEVTGWTITDYHRSLILI